MLTAKAEEIDRPDRGLGLARDYVTEPF